MKIFLVRHGKTEVKAGDFFGSHLTSAGIKDTTDLVQSGVISTPDIIITSPYPRAKETAKIFSDVFGVSYRLDEGLSEWMLQKENLNDTEYLEEEKKGWADFSYKVKGGESLNMVRDRASAALNSIIIDNPMMNNILIISHATFIDFFVGSLSGRIPSIFEHKSIKYLDYAVVEYKNKRFRVIKDIINFL